MQSYTLNKEYRRKLELQWLRPRLIINIPLKVLADVTNVYSNSKVKKYYLNDLKVYIPQVEQPDTIRFLVNNTKLLDFYINLAKLNIDPIAMKYTGALGSHYINLINPFIF